MSYGQRVASFEQFVGILNKSKAAGFRFAPAPDQIDGLMEGVMVSLRLGEMSVDYTDHVTNRKSETYVPRHRVVATVLFPDHASYVVDVPDAEWFELPSFDQWQAALPVIHLPSEVIAKILEEAPEMSEEAKAAKERLRSGLPEEPEEGWDAVKELRAMRDEDNLIAFGDDQEPEYLDGEDGDETGVREPVEPTEPDDTEGATVPLETPVG